MRNGYYNINDNEPDDAEGYGLICIKRKSLIFQQCEGYGHCRKSDGS